MGGGKASLAGDWIWLVWMIASLVAIGSTGCDRTPGPSRQSPSGASPAAARTPTLAEARRGFITRLTRKIQYGEAAPEPPAKVFRRAWFPSPLGNLVAYVTPPPGGGKRLPAIVWVTGGFSNSIGGNWLPSPPENDQSAGAFREAGIALMIPSRRGGNDNPGTVEGCFGEVDDVIAAADWLAKLDYVDPARIYLGGHSTGGTVALLVAESTERFRAVFSFGPVASVVGYGGDALPFDVSDEREARLRAPYLYMASIRSPTLVIEGAERSSNAGDFPLLARGVRGAPVEFHRVPGKSHFSVLAPITRLVAAKILADTGAAPNVTISEQEVAAAIAQP
jgi:Prolyl oligopeptidase family